VTAKTSDYFISVGGQQSGPFKGQQIRNKLSQGKIAETDFIWREGMSDWAQIASMIDELPGIEPPTPPPSDLPTSLTIDHPAELDLPPTVLAIPPKGIYEPAATLKQKNLLMKMGYKNPETLRHIGRDQASFMIDAVKTDLEHAVQHELAKRAEEKQRRQNKAAAIVFVIILVVIAVIAIFQIAR
jgi:hypothetical protein